MRYLTINIDVYGCKIFFIVTENILKEALLLYKKYKQNSPEDDGELRDNEGLYLTFNISNHYLLIHDKYLTHNTLAHEIHHVAHSIMNDRDVDDEEAEAWLCGYITEKVYLYLEKKKMKINHVITE